MSSANKSSNKSTPLLVACALVAGVFASGCATRTVYVVDDPDRPMSQPRASAQGGSYDYGPGQDFDDASQFYDPLDSYGRWYAHASYGRVWVPARSYVGTSWRPYTRGHWEYTEYGWTWVSELPFGWATFHYGRWFYDSNLGWTWVPGRQWSPAWVSWRYGGGYTGWAALPPGASYGGSYVVYDTSWVFVSNNRFGTTAVYSVMVTGPRYRQCLSYTRPYRNTVRHRGVVTYRGPDPDNVRNAGGRVVRRSIRDVDRDRPTSRPPRGTRISRPGDHDGSTGRTRPRDGDGGRVNGRDRDRDRDNGRVSGRDRSGDSSGRDRDSSGSSRGRDDDRASGRDRSGGGVALPGGSSGRGRSDDRVDPGRRPVDVGTGRGRGDDAGRGRDVEPGPSWDVSPRDARGDDSGAGGMRGGRELPGRAQPGYGDVGSTPPGGTPRPGIPFPGGTAPPSRGDNGSGSGGRGGSSGDDDGVRAYDPEIVRPDGSERRPPSMNPYSGPYTGRGSAAPPPTGRSSSPSRAAPPSRRGPSRYTPPSGSSPTRATPPSRRGPSRYTPPARSAPTRATPPSRSSSTSKKKSSKKSSSDSKRSSSKKKKSSKKSRSRR